MAEELDAIERTYDALAWTLDRIASFRKVYRIPLGDRMQDTLYSVPDELIVAKYTRGGEKIAALSKANRLLERVRFQGRLACDKACLSPQQHGHFSKLVNAAGVSVGGWMKSQKRRRAATTMSLLCFLGLVVGALAL